MFSQCDESRREREQGLASCSGDVVSAFPLPERGALPLIRFSS